MFTFVWRLFADFLMNVIDHKHSKHQIVGNALSEHHDCRFSFYSLSALFLDCCIGLLEELKFLSWKCYCEAIYVSSWEQGPSDTNVHWQVMQYHSLNNVSNVTCTHTPAHTEAHTTAAHTDHLSFALPSSETHTHTHKPFLVSECYWALMH